MQIAYGELGKNVWDGNRVFLTRINDREHKFVTFFRMVAVCLFRHSGHTQRCGQRKMSEARSNRRVLRSRWICCAHFFAFCVCFPTTNFTYSLQQHSLNYLQSLSLRCCFCYQSAATATLLQVLLLWRQKTKFIKANREKANINNSNNNDSNSEKRQKKETTNSSDICIYFAHSHAPRPPTNVDGILATRNKTFVLLSNPIDSFNHMKGNETTSQIRGARRIAIYDFLF